MSTIITSAGPQIEYPDCDGEPMSDNTLQFQWIMKIQGGCDALFASDPHVFVAGDLLWYPVQGDSVIRTAPDTMVVFGRPKGRRGSYQQWEESGIPPTVVFEVLSPGNRAGAMAKKFDFYQQYGVEEYYIYDPDDNELIGYLRKAGRLQKIPQVEGWTSPRLGVRFELASGEFKIIRPDGRPFTTFVETTEWAEQEHAIAEQERAKAEQERAKAEQERAKAQQAQARAEQLAAKLRALGIDPDSP